MGSYIPDSAGQQSSEILLRTMAEELKLPLLQIARQAELNRLTPDTANLESIEIAAERALWFVDSYLLSHQLLQHPTLELEPVAVSAVLHDVAHTLDKLAKQYDCNLELQLSGRYGPVMAHRQGLETALIGLGSTLITAVGAAEGSTIVLGAHKSPSGIVAGIFSETEGLSKAMFKQGKALYGKTRQPLRQLSATAGAGIYIADTICNSMATQLRVARHQKISGLAMTLHSSTQMALV